VLAPQLSHLSNNLPNNPPKAQSNNQLNQQPINPNKLRQIMPFQSKPSWLYRTKVSQNSTKNLGLTFA
ncbi:hypothetical protein S245_055443, partial [Arachis hypogaea]